MCIYVFILICIGKKENYRYDFKYVNDKIFVFYLVLMILYVCESGKGGGFVNSEKWGGGGLGIYFDYGI